MVIFLKKILNNSHRNNLAPIIHVPQENTGRLLPRFHNYGFQDRFLFTFQNNPTPLYCTLAS
jgi:hypothetical protein